MTRCRGGAQFVLVTARIHRDLVPVIERKAKKTGEKFEHVAGDLMQAGVEAERLSRGNRNG